MTDDPVQSELLLACRRVGAAMDLFDEAACRHLGIGRSDLRAMNLLEHGGLSAGTIAERLGLTRASVTSLVDRLEAAGYVARVAHPTDRRTVMVELRPATWRAFAAVYRPLGLRVADVTAALDDTVRDEVTSALLEMTRAFDAARRGLEDGPPSSDADARGTDR